jgi:spoIIIJ-associated protein
MSAIEAKEIAQKILDSMGVDSTLDIDSEEPIYISISSPDSALIIGKGGENLKALQNIVNTIYRHNNADGGYVGIDIAGYRKERVEKVQAMAQELADKVRETGQAEHLKPMNAFERRSVHTLLSEDPDLVTDSEGEGVNRHIVIRKR